MCREWLYFTGFVIIQNASPGGSKWNSSTEQRKSIERASRPTETVGGSISCISLCVEGPGDLSLLRVSAEWADIGACASSIMGHVSYIVFCGLLRLLYDQANPYTVCLWRLTSDPGLAVNPPLIFSPIYFPFNLLLPISFSIPSSISPLQLYASEPSFHFSIRICPLICPPSLPHACLLP